MANKFDYYQFSHTANPLGVIFHPFPLLDVLDRAMAKMPFTEEDLFEDRQQWVSFQAHSSMSNPDKAQCLTNLNKALSALSEKLLKASHLVITFGSAWGYLRGEQVVANCHKMPATHFEKALSPIAYLKTRLAKSVERLKAHNAKLTIILTVSPVRHIKDGMLANMHSKARLLELAYTAAEDCEAVHYFPAYEIMMDELRDYRFYKPDMIHPSQQAVDHIWEQFAATWVDPKTTTIQNRIANIRQRLAHRPLFPDSPEHAAFIAALEADIQSVRQQFPHIQFSL